MFRADVEVIARRFGLDAVRLGRVIRNANTLVALVTTYGLRVVGACHARGANPQQEYS